MYVEAHQKMMSVILDSSFFFTPLYNSEQFNK